MKILLTLSILFLFFTANAQFPIDPESGSVVYTDVIKLPDMDKSTIFEKAKFWIVSTLKSGDNMVELDGSSSDKIVGTGNILLDKLQFGIPKEKNISMYSNAILNFKFIVLVKDGKIKYIIKNFDLVFSHAHYSSVHSNLTNFKDCILPNHVYYRNAKTNENFEAVNTPYIDTILKSMIKDFSKSLEKKDTDDW